MAFNFQKVGVRDQLKNSVYLLKNTFTVIGRDKDIIRPVYRMLIYNFIMVLLFFGGLLSMFMQWSIGWGVVILLLSILMFVYKFFYFNWQEVRLSWIVDQTICGNDPSYKGAVKDVSSMAWQVRGLAFFDICAALLRS